jgi:hypothetical protein
VSAGSTGPYKAAGRKRARPRRESERLILPLASPGQQNPGRGKGPHFHRAADGAPGEGIAVRLVTPRVVPPAPPRWLDRRAERTPVRACRRLKVIGEPCAGKLHARFDEGALVLRAR